jgi:hypothetical protein
LAYTRGNPLKFTDPSGMLTDAGHANDATINWLSGLFDKQIPPPEPDPVQVQTGQALVEEGVLRQGSGVVTRSLDVTARLSRVQDCGRRGHECGSRGREGGGEGLAGGQGG